MGFKDWTRRVISDMNRRLSTVEVSQRAFERNSVGVRVEFETGLPVFTELMTAIPVYQERYHLVRGVEGERPYSVKDVGFRGQAFVEVRKKDGGWEPSPRDLHRLNHCESVRFYRKSSAPDCDFIDATGTEDRFVKLGNVNPEPKPKKRR